jgi:CHASE2 domain-containing sensor protein/signal transduction histidine kinase
VKINSLLAVFSFVILGLTLLAIQRDWAGPLNFLLYDHQIKTMDMPSDQDVVIVAIDNASLNAIGEWPWSRAFHAEAIDMLFQSGAKAIAYNLVLSHARTDDVAGDLALRNSLMLGKVVLPVYIERNLSSQQNNLVFPHSMFAKNALLGHVNMVLDHDGVARTINLKEGIGVTTWPHFSQQLLNLANGNLNAEPQRTKKNKNPVHLQKKRRYIPFVGDVGSVNSVSFLDLLSGRVASDFFKDKVVLVGMTATSIGDSLSTPYTSAGKTMSAVEVNANIFQGLRHNRMIEPVPVFVHMSIALLMLVTVLIWVPKLSGMAQIGLVLFFCGATYTLSQVLLHSFNYWLPMGILLLALVAIVPLWNALRYQRFLIFMVNESKALQGNRKQGLFSSLEVNTSSEFERRLLALLALLTLHGYRLQRDKNVIEQYYHPQEAHKIAAEKNYTLHIFGHEYKLKVFFVTLGDSEQSMLRIIAQTFNRVRISKAEKRTGSDVLMDKMDYFKGLQYESLKTQILFQTAIDKMGGGLLVADESGFLIFHNQQAKSMLKVDPNEDSVFHPLEQLTIKDSSASWRSLVRSVLLNSNGVQVQASSKTYPDLDVNLSTMHDPQSNQTLILVNMSNIEKIKQAQRIRNETIDFLSHDMRAPMTSLLALTQRQREYNDISGPDFLSEIEKYAMINLHYSEQFLHLARVESSEAIDMYELDIGALIQNALDSIYLQALAKGVHFIFNEPDDIWVKGNGEILERVMINLLTNAVKYGKANSEVLISIEENGLDFTVSVKNSGPAIPDTLQKTLFKPFKRAVLGQESSQNGVGLGLRFVFVSLQRHNSNIQFISDDQFTCFYFSLTKIALTPG